MIAWPAFILLLIGGIIGIVRVIRGPGRAHWAVSLSYLAAHTAIVAWLGSADPRALLPVMPILCLVTAAGLISGVSALRRYEFPRAVRTAMISALTVIVLLPGAIASVQYVRDRSKQSTEDLAYQWVRANVPPTAVVVVEAAAMSIPRSVVNGRGVKELGDSTYDQLADDGVDYAIASSTAYGRYMAAPATYRAGYLAYTRLFSEAREVARFSPSREHPGPELRVLRISRKMVE